MEQTAVMKVVMKVGRRWPTRQTCSPTPGTWAGGRREVYVRIHPVTVTGRRITVRWDTTRPPPASPTTR